MARNYFLPRGRTGYTVSVATIETDQTALVTLTEAAADKVRAMMAQEPAGEAEVLRVAVRGGGCSGFEYALGFDRGPSDDDYEFQAHGVTVVVDPFSAPYLKGASVDFLETIAEAGFKIDNPNSAGSCGCGHSFQPADGSAEGAAEDAGGCGSGCSH
jgi:iron-sulfur cluster assembly protein